MILGVDASNLRYGGGTTHLVELLSAASPHEHGFDRVVVWGCRATLDRLPARTWLTRVHDPALEGPLPQRAAWQTFALPTRLAASRCDLLFAPGGTAPGSVRPRVVMCRNMLPFDPVERARYGATLTRLRLEVLHVAQARAMATADGVIFLTEHARDAVCADLPARPQRSTIIPHGVSPRFLRAPRPPRPLSDCTPERPFRWVYVSTVTRYKHQHVVAEAMRRLRDAGLPVAVDFIGAPDDAASTGALRRFLDAHDPEGRWAAWRGHVPFEDLAALYARADAAVYASSCENMPNILLESMASGLPVASSDRGPMPEMLGADAVYFDPEDAADIARAAGVMLRDPALRARIAAGAWRKAQAYSWGRCAVDTFEFLRAVASTARA